MNRGALVPDEVVISLIRSELNTLAKDTRLLFDGFPRTLPQAKLLSDLLVIDAVVALAIPHQTIADRMANRWIHLPSGRTYSYDYKPPKMKG
jgi:adenylate kinase family enzyme